MYILGNNMSKLFIENGSYYTDLGVSLENEITEKILEALSNHDLSKENLREVIAVINSAAQGAALVFEVDTHGVLIP